jgi:hypothetical protein
MIPRPGLCLTDDGQALRYDWKILQPRSGFKARKLGPAFFLSPDPNGHLSLAYMQGCFFSIALDFHRGRWMELHQYLHCVRREQIDRQKTHPWRYHKDKWDGVKVSVLPRTDSDGLVMDSNTAVVIERKRKEIGGVPAVPGAVIVKGGGQMDCDYSALAHIIGHGQARECFQKHGRKISG